MQSEIIKGQFINNVGKSPELVVNAPGRINLIGEHTDYNDGFVLPAAIDKSIVFAIGKRTDLLIKIWAIDLQEYIEFSLENLVKTDKSWANYLIGIISELRDSGFPLTSGCNIVYGGDIPLGAGLSSSAAVESGIAFALNELFGFGLNRKELALLAQRAEQRFAGVNCGIMDMYASLQGQKDAVILLDCKTIEHNYYPFNFPDYQIVLCNTGVKHNLGESEYNTRRNECETGVSILKQFDDSIETLRDVSPEFFTKYKNQLPLYVLKRCRYVVCEMERVEWACQALVNNDIVSFGYYMYQTHKGLSEDYEVSCPELDFLVEQTIHSEDVIGSRMMGGGFGGCTINIVKEDAVESFIDSQKKKYKEAFNRELECYIVSITDGVSLI